MYSSNSCLVKFNSCRKTGHYITAIQLKPVKEINYVSYSRLPVQRVGRLRAGV